jgi:putative ABC transport system permease protein
VFVTAAKRLLARRWLAAATGLGLVTSVALTMSIPLYADGVYYRVLREELSKGSPLQVTSRSPFAFQFRYMGYPGSPSGPVDWEEIQQVDTFLSERAGVALGLPQRFLVRHFRTGNFRLFPQEDVAYADSRNPLASTSLAFATDLEDHITILEGSFPEVAAPAQDSAVEVLLNESLAMKLGLQVGETYMAFSRRRTGGDERTSRIPVRVAGIWTATDPQEEFWFTSPEFLDDVLFVPEETFLGRISPYMEDEIYMGLWYLLMDGSKVYSTDVLPLLSRITAVQQRAASILPNTRLDVSPAEALREYRSSARLLTLSLYAFSIPVIGLTLAFIGLVVGLSVGRQRNEIAVLRSRGATTAQVVGIAALEGLLLGALALGFGSPASQGIARIIGRARSFLDFTLRSNLRVGVTMATAQFGVAAVGLALLAQVVPTFGAARHTIVTYKQERARTLRPPWWQRAWVDVLLLIPVAYGVYLMRKQGGIALQLGGAGIVGDPLQNPLLFLLPALSVFALTLFVLRLLPALMVAIAWIASHTRGVGVLLAVRQLSRATGLYAAPLVLLILTLSLSAFTASLAQTLDTHLHDQKHYEIGADIRLVERGDPYGSSGQSSGATSEEGGEEEEYHWVFLPVSEHLKVPGVRAAARVGRYAAFTQLSGGRQVGTFIGVDRFDFPQVAFWRRDFAPASLGSLMNALAIYPDGVLVPRSFMGQHGLKVGDAFRVKVNTIAYGGGTTDLDVKVAGGFDLFPTWYPADGPLFVGNLEALFERAGAQFPYDVWLETDSGVDYDQAIEAIVGLGLRVADWAAPLPEISDEQRRPGRQGLFGLLSVGFVAAALLTVLGFLLYALFSFRRRFIELGVLRAIGLSAGQMTAFLAWELAFLILTGVIAGTGLGAWVSGLFIPYLQVGAGPAALTPPFVVEIAWPAILRIYALFGSLFVVALAVLVALLLRMKIFQAIKLGETA